ncbi:hypothetical protein HDU84_005082 [Entophlyctis sp. JEL0112]|nr:hypothetical protein HDU84_005082 [Entophlyctis sp. JEL0112]
MFALAAASFALGFVCAIAALAVFVGFVVASSKPHPLAARCSGAGRESHPSSASNAFGHPSDVLGNNGDYEPQLLKVGWMRLSERPLSPDELFMDRFLGKSATLPEIAMELPLSESHEDKKPHWEDFFAVLKRNVLFLYSSDEKLECLKVFHLNEFDVNIYLNGIGSMHPTNNLEHKQNLSDFEIYHRNHPIRLRKKDCSKENHLNDIFVYVLTGSEKEDWNILMRRSSSIQQPYSHAEAELAYTDALAKLAQSVGSSESPIDPSTAWINALLGRMFVGLHANSNIKTYLMQKLGGRIGTNRNAFASGFLGEITIRDLHMGNSLPVLKNPRIVSFSLDSDLVLDVDVTYTGGIQIETATEAKLSALNPIFNSQFDVPFVVSIKVSNVTATLRLKIKGFQETSRVWVGLHDNLKIGIQVEPMISNKLVQLQLVDQIIEHRIKDALTEFIILPNMDDFGFWPFGNQGGFFGTVSGDCQTACEVQKTSYSHEKSLNDLESHSKFTQAPDNSLAEDNLTESPANGNSQTIHSPNESNISYSSSILTDTNSSNPPVVTSEFSVDKTQYDSDSEILLETVAEQARSQKLHAVNTTFPDSSSEENDGPEELEAASVNANLDANQLESQNEKNPRRTVFEFAGRIAEYTGNKFREYRVKQIARTAGKTAALAMELGLGYLGYKRVDKQGRLLRSKVDIDALRRTKAFKYSRSKALVVVNRENRENEVGETKNQTTAIDCSQKKHSELRFPAYPAEKLQNVLKSGEICDPICDVSESRNLLLFAE